MELHYTKVGGYLLLNLTVTEQKGGINKYGYLRLNYLKKHKKGLYRVLLMQDKLSNHLISVSNEATNKVNSLIEKYKEIDKLTEKNKEKKHLNG